MKKNYEIQGMSCGGCVNSVKNALHKFPGVEDAEVHLHPQTAVLTMSKSIDVDELQTQLSKVGHYTIKEVVLK
ncbi:MAG: heavy-metal-associated domain-containing protein [Chitinophagaceae bacterium]|nr:heavy-metal-associated domain-containing protein [Chitinophagaceae bacterium]MBK8787042.1 heavy-metal-associated domain-containing protein [Chitinophagaceae bacterium]